MTHYPSRRSCGSITGPSPPCWCPRRPRRSSPAIRTVLTAHNPLEEGPGGVYERCEHLAGAEADALLAQLQAAPEVPVAPYADGPQVMRVVRRTLARAGYDIELGE